MRFKILTFRLFLIGLLLGLSTCCEPPRILDHIRYQVFANEKKVHLSLYFHDIFHSNVGGTTQFKDIVNKISSQFFFSKSPLHLDLVITPQILELLTQVPHFTLTRLPNGGPLPNVIDRALASFEFPELATSQYTVSLLVDLNVKQWAGVLYQFKFEEEEFFPEGSVYSKDFLRDAEGRAKVAASVYGSKKDESGNIISYGGILLMGNLPELLKLQPSSGKETGQPTFVAFESSAVYSTNPKDKLDYEAITRAVKAAKDRGF